MNKRDLIMLASAKSGVSQLLMKKCLNQILSSILESLEEGETVTLNNFGTFQIKSRKERNSIDPRNGKRIIVQPKKVVKFHITPKLTIK